MSVKYKVKGNGHEQKGTVCKKNKWVERSGNINEAILYLFLCIYACLGEGQCELGTLSALLSETGYRMMTLCRKNGD